VAGRTRGAAGTRSARARRAADDIDLNDWGIGATVVVAAIAATFAECQPTTWEPADVALTALLAGVTTLAASQARRWTWLLTAGVAGFFARGDALLVCAAVAVAISIYAAAIATRRNRLAGAVVGATAVQVLLRMPELRFNGLTAGLAVVAILPMWVSAYRLCRRSTRRQIRRVAFVGGSLLLLATVGLAMAALDARNTTQSAVSDMRLGLDAARAGKQDDAATHFDAARRAFVSANSAFSSWFARPARAVPILSQHLRAARIMASAGEDLAGTAEVAATTARYEDLRTSGGQVNLPLLASMAPPVSASVDSLVRADDQLQRAPSEWLLPTLADPLEDFRRQVRDTLPEARNAADAVRSVPPLLGADGPRRYFIAFGTPSESRALGGFIGSFGELEVVNGKIRLARSGSILEVSQAPGFEQRTLAGMDAYLERYGRFQPARYVQNTAASPDFPTVAEALRQLYPQAGGSVVDGVIYVDPEGIAALLKVTGPVNVEGLDHQLTADNAAEFLLRDQYVQFPSKNGADGRNEMLVRATRATFEALTSRSLPGPRTFIDALSPAATAHRLQFVSFHENDRAFLERLHVTGAFPVADPPTDFLSFRTSNGGANKIDSFLERTIDYHVRADPTTGTADITAKVTLHNRAPSSGLPDYIIANNPGAPGVPTEPDGTNVLDFSLYGDGTLQSATRDGVALPVQAQLEFGHHVWSNRVSIPPGGQTTLEFHLTTTIEGGRYRLDVAGQPVARDDQLSVLVDVAPGWTVREASGWPSGTPRDARLGDGWTRVGTEQRTAQQGDVRFEVETSP
jgi:hypothetical protein